MKYFNEVRNFDKVQFETLRKQIDGKYNSVHDELSDCYYNKKPFRAYGVLNKETFDKLHGLIFLQREVEFHEENLKQPEKDQYDEEKYNIEKDKDGNIIKNKYNDTKTKIEVLKDDGIELII